MDGKPMSQAIAQLVTLTLNPQIARRIRRTKFRPPKPKLPVKRTRVPSETWAQIERLGADQGLSNRQVADVVGVSIATVARLRRKLGLNRPTTSDIRQH